MQLRSQVIWLVSKNVLVSFKNRFNKFWILEIMTAWVTLKSVVWLVLKLTLGSMTPLFTPWIRWRGCAFNKEWSLWPEKCRTWFYPGLVPRLARLGITAHYTLFRIYRKYLRVLKFLETWSKTIGKRTGFWLVSTDSHYNSLHSGTISPMQS